MPKHRYSICGFSIRSEKPLHIPPAAPDDSANWLDFSWPSSLPCPEPHHWFRDMTLPNGEPWLRIARTAAGFWLRFHAKSDFLISASGDQVACQPSPGIPDDSIEHLLLDQVLPFLIARRGHTVLHGSAVALHGGALAFCGPAGRGKSTLATAFVNRGAQILTDDCLVLQPSPAGFLVLPSYPGVRLWNDSFQHFAPNASSTRVSHYSDKRRLALPAATPVPLRRLFFLESGPTFQTAPLRGSQLFQILSRTQFLLDNEDPTELQTALARTAALARAGLCFQLTLPRGLDHLPRWIDLLSNHPENE
jgi:hypothetical protein